MNAAISPALPCSVPQNNGTVHHFKGMWLRDYVATAALQGLLAAGHDLIAELERTST
jgi:hypothetical protein